MLADGQATVTILNDDPGLSISDGNPRNVTEGNSGSTPVTFTVTLANGVDPVTVQYTAPNNGHSPWPVSTSRRSAARSP